MKHEAEAKFIAPVSDPIHIETEAGLWMACLRLSINCNVFILFDIQSLRDDTNIYLFIGIALFIRYSFFLLYKHYR